MTANHRLAFAYENRPDTHGRVSTVFIPRADKHVTLAATGDWEFSIVLTRLAVEAHKATSP